MKDVVAKTTLLVIDTQRLAKLKCKFKPKKDEKARSKGR